MLIIQLKRQQFNKSTNSVCLASQLIDCPSQLDISNVNSSRNQPVLILSKKFPDTVYDLIAVCHYKNKVVWGITLLM